MIVRLALALRKADRLGRRFLRLADLDHPAHFGHHARKPALGLLVVGVHFRAIGTDRGCGWRRRARASPIVIRVVRVGITARLIEAVVIADVRGNLTPLSRLFRLLQPDRGRLFREHEILGELEHLILAAGVVRTRHVRHRPDTALAPASWARCGTLLRLRRRDRRAVIGDNSADRGQDFLDRRFGGLLWLSHQNLRRLSSASPAPVPARAVQISVGHSDKK